mmetsp:Transcript_24365/g.43285  ORF Transcript_24365/g.43285 Transcript_24365/m.43285 type:complete len:658 (-) Transcript_24365:283-2256(-)|eukprot:CAMPEP_0204899762 /NCGR_PEP_ID=MMETSP1397-20131031/2038_1 /ASSEMBLY_ACC=CAM_ASM_000891 /TAXON_ID=49980 /ORGANISM="Climacostomum Climacostomum virens, Strain Stock W-24" /LENGTH=657 /DNA_ID=CAMNT_0052067757 /DNA_START=256 /DNA_END=2229 /DNA_ORIENTATION=+
MVCKAKDTFSDLALKVGEYHSITQSLVFFAVSCTQDSADSDDCIVYPPEGKLLDYLYPWGSHKLSFANEKVYLIIRSFKELDSIILPSEEESDFEDFALKEVQLSDLIGERLKKEEAEVRKKINARMIGHRFFTIAETVLYIMIITFWLVYVALAQDIDYLYSMNSTILKSITGARHVGDVTYSTYESDFLQKSSFFGTRTASAILSFISNIEYVIYLSPFVYNNKPGSVSEGILYFPYFQLRTKRTKVEQCDVAEFDVDLLCATDFNHEITPRLGDRPPYIEWEEGDTRSVGLRSYREVRSVSGNVLDMPTQNYTEFKLKQHALTDVDYITQNTRYIATTINFFSPGRELVALHAYIFEFDLQSDIVASYDLYSYSSRNYTAGELVLAVIIVILCLVHMALVFRTVLRDQSEIEYYGQRKVHLDNFTYEQLKSQLSTWSEHSTQACLRRLRKPIWLESIVLISDLGVILVLFVKMGWFYSYFNEEFDVPKHEYIDLLYLSQLRQAVFDLQGFILVIQAVGMFKYFMLWYSPMTFISNMLRFGFFRLKGFFVVVIVVMIGFSVSFYLIIGPYEYRAASLYLLIAGMSRCFSGRWFAGDDFIKFITPFTVIVLYVFFILFRYTVFLFTIINLQQAYMETRDKYEAGRENLKRKTLILC